MLSTKLGALFAVSIVAAYATSAIVTPVYDDNVTRSSLPANAERKFWRENETLLTDADDDDDADDGENAKIDEIPLKLLENGELNALLDNEDTMVQSDLDICVLRTIVQTRTQNTIHQSNGTNSKVRKKRIVPLLFGAARLLFTGAARAARPTISGSRITQQYIKKGGFGDAVKHFNALRPQNVKTFSQNGISGRTGTVGNHRVTVRDGSKQGSPTLEIRTPRPKGEYVRKFRFER